MFQNGTFLANLISLFRMVISTSLLLTFIACSKTNTADVAVRRRGDNQNRQISAGTLLQQATETTGSNVAGYAGLGLVSLKSIDRAIDFALNQSKASRQEFCQTVNVSKENESSTKVEIVTDLRLCKVWSGIETLIVRSTSDKTAASSAITKVGLQSISKSDDSPLNINGPEGSKTQPTLILQESYTITQKSGAIYSFSYTGKMNYAYSMTVSTPAPRRQSDAKPTGPNSPKPIAPVPAPPPAEVKTTSYQHKSTITAAGAIDLTDLSNRKIILDSLEVALIFGQDSKAIFSTIVTTAASGSPMPITCGVPTGTIAFEQTFTDETIAASSASDSARSKTFHPTVKIENSQINDMRALPTCTTVKGFSDLQETVATSTNYMVNGTARKIQTSAAFAEDLKTNEVMPTRDALESTPN